MTKTLIVHQDTGELLGVTEQTSAGWTAQTVFGYVFARSDSEDEVSQAVRSQGRAVIDGLWQYYDEDEKTWCTCVIKEALENRVTIVRTTSLGYESSDLYKRVVIRHPSETKLIKS